MVGGHAYALPTTPNNPNRTITISIARSLSGETLASVTSSAVVLASLITTSAGTTLTEAPGKPFTDLVGTFTADALAQPSDFVATINWGDGTPNSQGQVDEPNGDGRFRVFGSHTYANPTPSTPYSISVVVTQKTVGGSTTIMSQAFVTAPGFVGGLDPLSDTGSSNADGITRINTPTLLGTATPYSLVQVYARGPGGGDQVPLGQTVANANGAWRLVVVSPLPDGRYTLSAVVTPTVGSPITDQAFATDLVIDTVGPRVQSVRYNPRTGGVTVIFEDDRSGLNLASLMSPLNYNLVGHPGRAIANDSPALVGRRSCRRTLRKSSSSSTRSITARSCATSASSPAG